MGFRDAVELGVAAFMAFEEPDQQEVYESLVAVGVEDWLALRLVYWLPSAFARHRYSEVDFSDTYSEPGATRRLSEDPVFVAAAKRAKGASEDEIECIAALSSEARVIEKHLAEGGAAARGTAATALVSALPPRAPGDGGVLEPRAVFAAMLQGHGHHVVEQADGSYRCGGLVIDAHVYPTLEAPGIRARVDFEIRHPRLAKGELYECFLGVGSSYRAAMSDAIHKFERGSVHAIIAALLDAGSCPDQVSWEDWPHPEGTLHVCVGGQLLLYGAGPTPITTLVDGLLSALESERLGPGVHALRLFTMRAGKRAFGDEVLLDGEPWEAGLSLCAEHDWPEREPAWGTRLFVMFTTDEPARASGKTTPAPCRSPERAPPVAEERLARLRLFLALGMVLPLAVVAFAAATGFDAPIAARVAYVVASLVALVLLAAARHTAAAAVAVTALALALIAEHMHVGPFGLPAEALLTAVGTAAAAVYAMKYVVRPSG